MARHPPTVGVRPGPMRQTIANHSQTRPIIRVIGLFVGNRRFRFSLSTCDPIHAVDVGRLGVDQADALKIHQAELLTNSFWLGK